MSIRAAADFALGMLAYQKSETKPARVHLGHALALRPTLLFDSALFVPLHQVPLGTTVPGRSTPGTQQHVFLVLKSAASTVLASRSGSVDIKRFAEGHFLSMVNVKSRLAPALIALALAMVVSSAHVGAQDWKIAWSPARNISNTPTSSNRPAMAADAAGNVHVIWTEDMGGKSVLGIPNQLTVGANTLVYTRWDGAEWSDPIDIIALSDDNVAEYPSLVIDSQQVLHLVWTGVASIYYSRAPAEIRRIGESLASTHHCGQQCPHELGIRRCCGCTGHPPHRVRHAWGRPWRLLYENY